jgi:hypothetical protein
MPVQLRSAPVGSSPAISPATCTTGTGIGLWLPPGATTESDKQRTPVKVVAYDLGVCKGKRAYLQMDVYFPRHGGRFRPGPHDGICH